MPRMRSGYRSDLQVTAVRNDHRLELTAVGQTWKRRQSGDSITGCPIGQLGPSRLGVASNVLSSETQCVCPKRSAA